LFFWLSFIAWSEITAVLGHFEGGGTVELSAPDTIRHYGFVYTAKAFEFLSVLLGPQQWKTTFRTGWYIVIIFRQLIVGVASRTDQMGTAALLPGPAFLSEW
jgi:hypothetical protein